MDVEDLLGGAELRAAEVDIEEALPLAVARGRRRRLRRRLAVGSALATTIALVAGVALLRDEGNEHRVVAGPRAAPTTTVATQPDHSATAVWDIDPAAPPTPSASSFTALVTRLECSGGVTGEVLPPGLVETEDAVTVTFTVEPQAPGSARCPGNDWVPYEIQLGEPLGDRVLIDGGCSSEEAGGTSFCASGQVRWPTEASCPDALPVPVDIPLQVTTQLPDGDVRVHGDDPQWLVPVGPAGTAVMVTTTGEPGVAVLEVRYELEDPRSDVVRRFPGAPAQPTTIRWDGTDADGVPVPAGRYQLRYRAVVGRDVRPCQDRTGAQVGGGLGWFVVAD